jgi:hypothetical protein
LFCFPVQNKELNVKICLARNYDVRRTSDITLSNTRAVGLKSDKHKERQPSCTQDIGVDILYLLLFFQLVLVSITGLNQ